MLPMKGRPVLAAFERPPRSGAAAALWAGLRAAADARLLVGGAEPSWGALEPDAEAFALAIRRAAGALSPSAIVLHDGPAARRALPALRDAGAPVALALDGGAPPAPGSSSRRPGPVPRGRPYPAEIWSFGPEPPAAPPRELLPGAFHHARKAAPAWLARRLRALGEEAPPEGLVSVIIPCWNGLALTKRCLRRLLDCTEQRFEAVVVDNGSTDGTADYVRSLGDRRLRVLRNERNRGFARAVNQGLAAARGAYCVWLNNDCFVTPGWLGRMLAALERAPWVGAVGPCTNETSGVQRVERPGYAGLAGLSRFAAAWALSRAGRVAPVHRLVGFCLLHRAELARRIGGLDERFGLGCYEDLDFCLRARQAGYELLVAEDVYVHHEGHAAFASNGVSFDEQARANRELFIEKWCRRSLEYLDELDRPLAELPARR